MRTGRAVLTLTTAALIASACGGVPPPPAPVRPSSDLVVLIPDPEDAKLGSAVVRAQGGAVELSLDGASTRIVGGQPPTPSVTLPADDIQRIFGSALSARPLAPRRFLLYFQTGSDDLTQESQAELPQIVEFVRNRPVPDVSVIGHTDTTGAAEANTELGLRRATLIGRQLIAAGLPADQVDVTSHGEANLLVQTADNVPEARNRRVEVTVR